MICHRLLKGYCFPKHAHLEIISNHAQFSNGLQPFDVYQTATEKNETYISIMTTIAETATLMKTYKPN